MSKDSRAGKTCLITLNVVLIALACVLLGSVIYMGRDNAELPPFMEALKDYQTLMIWVAIVLFLMGILGVCASFGGCLLLFYTVAITLVTLVCIALLGLVIYAFYMTKAKPEESNFVLDLVDNTTMEFVTAEKNAEAWKKMQEGLECCGYNGIAKTHEENCNPAQPKQDCRDHVLGALTQYILNTVIAMAVITVLVIAINCASCKAMSSFCSNN